MNMYALHVRLNTDQTYTALSAERGGLSVHLYTSDVGFLHLRVTVKTGSDQKQDFWLRTVKPPDRITFTYAKAQPADVDSMAGIEGLARDNEAYQTPAGKHLGFDVALGEDHARLSHPKNGGFDFMLSNVPLDHARCFVMAGNEEEDWNWQLPDLQFGESIKLELVETDWCSEFPRVTPRSAGG